MALASEIPAKMTLDGDRSHAANRLTFVLLIVLGIAMLGSLAIGASGGSLWGALWGLATGGGWGRAGCGGGVGSRWGR